MSLPALLEQRLRLPLVAAPMFLVSNPQLVLACCNSGIVGSFPALNQRDSGGFKATCTVTVKIPVTSVTLPVNTITLKVGETYQIAPVINPSNATIQTVAYTSNRPANASVSADGLVTALKAGTATITVKADGKAVTLRVTVRN